MSKSYRPALVLGLIGLCSPRFVAELGSSPPAGLDFERLAALRRVEDAVIAPDGTRVAFVLRVPRRAGRDEDGRAWTELHLVPFEGGPSRPYVHGEVEVSKPRFTPDGRLITYLAKRGEDKYRALWAIPVAGGESRKLVDHPADIDDYRISPDGERVAFLAPEEETDRRKKAREKGYKQQVFEEDWQPSHAWIVHLAPFEPAVEDPAAPRPASKQKPTVLAIEGSVSDLDWNPDGKSLALAVSATPSADERMMARRIQIVEAPSGKWLGSIENPGKLGEFAFGPNGRWIALVSAADPADPREGRLLASPIPGGELRDLLPGLQGHVRQFAWRDGKTLTYVADVGVGTVHGEVDLVTKRSRTHLAADGTSASPLLSTLSLSTDGRRAVFVGDAPSHPPEVHALVQGRAELRRLTDSNPWLAGVGLARQEVVRFTARDGLELEGVLLHPLEPRPLPPAALLLMVHGGPEAHDRNGWVTSYSRPGQLAATRGYAVFYPNYRGSTGRGVEFSKAGQADAAGREFDDLIDAVDHLVAQGVADPRRVGITGGSYGGYATAWGATRYSERFRAGVMFVGISDLIGKALTTDIPTEERMVHALADPWTRWQYNLERSPIFHAERSHTALLIAGGSDDTRVHPSQSLELYRALKLMGKTVRYVRYPGEGHGIVKAAGQDDYTRRLVAWMDHFVRDGRDELPPWELERPVEDDDDEEDEN